MCSRWYEDTTRNSSRIIQLPGCTDSTTGTKVVVPKTSSSALLACMSLSSGVSTSRRCSSDAGSDASSPRMLSSRSAMIRANCAELLKKSLLATPLMQIALESNRFTFMIIHQDVSRMSHLVLKKLVRTRLSIKVFINESSVYSLNLKYL